MAPLHDVGAPDEDYRTRFSDIKHDKTGKQMAYSEVQMN